MTTNHQMHALRSQEMAARHQLPSTVCLTASLVSEEHCAKYGPLRFSDLLGRPRAFGLWVGPLFEALRMGAYGCAGLGTELAGRVLVALLEDGVAQVEKATGEPLPQPGREKVLALLADMVGRLQRAVAAEAREATER